MGLSHQGFDCSSKPEVLRRRRRVTIKRRRCTMLYNHFSVFSLPHKRGHEKQTYLLLSLIQHTSLAYHRAANQRNQCEVMFTSFRFVCVCSVENHSECGRREKWFNGNAVEKSSIHFCEVVVTEQPNITPNAVVVYIFNAQSERIRLCCNMELNGKNPVFAFSLSISISIPQR